MVRLQCERVLFAVVSQHRYGNQSPKITDTAEPKFRVTILLERSIFREHLSPGSCSPPRLPLHCTNCGRWSLQAQKPPRVSSCHTIKLQAPLAGQQAEGTLYAPAPSTGGSPWHGACGELGHLGPGWGIPSAEERGHGAGEKIPGGAGLARQQDTGQSAGAWKQQPQAGQGRVEAGVAEEDGGCSTAHSSPGRVLSAQHAVPRPHSTSTTGQHGLRSPQPGPSPPGPQPHLSPQHRPHSPSQNPAPPQHLWQPPLVTAFQKQPCRVAVLLPWQRGLLSQGCLSGQELTPGLVFFSR